MQTIECTPVSLNRSLKALIATRTPACIWGSPGIGKSAVVDQTRTEMGRLFYDLRAVLLDAVDLRGIPYLDAMTSTTRWAVPDFLPKTGSGVLFIDEINRARTEVQNALFQLILDRKLGDYVLPDGWAIIAAANRESDGGGVTKMSQALCNRFIHLNMTVSFNDWRTWAVKHLEPSVVAFISWRPDLLHQFSRTENAFPTPRTWEYVSSVVASNPDRETLLILVAGAVGYGAAIEFIAFMDLYQRVPSIDGIVLNPTTATVPTDAQTLYATSAALARRSTLANFGRVITYLNRLPAEFAVLAIKAATGRDDGLTATPEFNSWAIANAEVCL